MLEAILSIMFAILAHEAGHALAALCFSCKLRGWRVWPFPSVLVENPHHRGKNALIALAAPVFNLVLLVAFGMRLWGIMAAGQLVVAVLALLPYPKSDSWRAVMG